MADWSPSHWSELAKGKLALVRVGTFTAASYINYGAARSAPLARPARGIEEIEIVLTRTVAALHIARRCNSVADASSRFELSRKGASQQVSGAGSPEIWSRGGGYMLAPDSGHNVRSGEFVGELRD